MKQDASRPRPGAHPVLGATPFPLDRGAVIRCLDTERRPEDAPFATAFAGTLAALEPSERRGAICGVIGHVAESVVEAVLEELGWLPVWHFVGPGRHGVDLLMLTPDAERVFAFEVKGTLRPRRWPRLRRGELPQMDVAWLDKWDNPAMREWGATSEDVYGGLALVNFADLRYKIALTSDFATWRAVLQPEQLETVEWLDERSR